MRTFRIALHSAIGAGLLVTLFFVTPVLWADTPDACPIGSAALPNGPLFFFGLGFVLIGSLAVLWYPLAEWGGRDRGSSARKMIQAMMGAVLLLLTFALSYEALGVMNIFGLHPITTYVRCATIIGLSGDLWGHLATGIIVGSICFLVGHWLLPWQWHPDQVRAAAARTYRGACSILGLRGARRPRDD